ncbi:MAG: FKBP-type peptidyl-prolyl cis-trans isomerase [Defluviitaleaceae bacterium]|nr:FKBP-type peptidyl-prolyl cis-trans isomerase [Defluviitaleaceae bacterium]
MKKIKPLLGGILLLAIALTMPTSCGRDTDTSGNDAMPTPVAAATGNDNDSAPTPVQQQEVTGANDNDAPTAPEIPPIVIPGGFSFSEGLTEGGFWQGVTAANYVEMFNHAALPIPSEVHYVSTEIVQAEIDNLASIFAGESVIMDRPVAVGDRVIIDFVGSVDGVEFEGGNTEGMGMEVTIGVTQFIDDFLYQLVGAMPGDVVNVEVTFPDVYHEPSLEGAEALFVTTIIHIVEAEIPEITDAFVVENLQMFFGWSTVAEMEEGIREELGGEGVPQFVENFLLTEVVVNSIPESIIEFHINSMLANFKIEAENWGVEFEDFLETFIGVESEEELIEMHMEEIMEQAHFYLVIQAVAEAANITVDREDVDNFFVNVMGMADYSVFEEMYGLPFLKKVTLSQTIINYLVENAELQ